MRLAEERAPIIAPKPPVPCCIATIRLAVGRLQAPGHAVERRPQIDRRRAIVWEGVGREYRYEGHDEE